VSQGLLRPDHLCYGRVAAIPLTLPSECQVSAEPHRGEANTERTKRITRCDSDASCMFAERPTL
jgi:hypothetical protein